MPPFIVVESGAKTKTIRQFLRGLYKVIACGGHIVDLPKDRLGIHVDDSFEFEVEPLFFRGSNKVESLKGKLADASVIYLATDPDREGEAIAQDILDYCVPPNVPVHRIEFNAIVYPEVVAALENPREIDLSRVEAQRARRSLDRLIGFILSTIASHDPEGPGCPAVGRVQSPALALVVDREREIGQFERRDYWVVNSELKTGESSILAEFEGEWSTFESATRVCEEIQQAGVQVAGVDEDANHLRHPRPPFTTDTLIDEADRLLGFPSEKTMRLAQQLYEGVEIDSRRQALITYMRTDSTRVSPVAINKARKALERYPGLGPEYYQGRPWKPVGQAQDAHEAVRPAHPEEEGFFPEELCGKIPDDLYRLYRLIYVRFLCSQMKPAVYYRTVLSLESGRRRASATIDQLLEKGFQQLWETISEGETAAATAQRPDVSVGQVLDILRIWPEHRHTVPPPRYREGSLIRNLKDLGIGRPSTYSTVIEKLVRFSYVRKRHGRLRPTERGEALVDYLRENHPQAVAFEYTAHMEDALDEIERVQKQYDEFLSAEWGWLEERYHAAASEGWLEGDLPSPRQVSYLESLEKETGIPVPKPVYGSSRKVSEWIEKLKVKTVLTLTLTPAEEVDVQGVLCYQFRLYSSKPLPDQERAFLREKGMRPGWDKERSSRYFQFTRQDRQRVEELWTFLKDRYSAMGGVRLEIE